MVVKRQLNNTSCHHQYGRKYEHTLHIFSAHILPSWRYSETKDFNRNSCGWWWVGEIQSKSANLKSHKYIHSEENTFICKLYKYSSTPAICFNEPMFVQEKSDYCKKCNLSFIPSLHFTSQILVHSGGKPSQVPRPTLHS